MHIFLIIIGVLLLAGCPIQLVQDMSVSAPPASSTDTSVSTALTKVASGSITGSLALDASSYEPQEQAVATLTIRNTGSGPVTIRFPRGLQANFSVTTAEPPFMPLWELHTVDARASFESSLTLGAGESHEFSTPWALDDQEHRKLPAGSYRMHATLLADGITLEQTALFTIVSSDAIEPFTVRRTIPASAESGIDSTKPIYIWLSKALDPRTAIRSNVSISLPYGSGVGEDPFVLAVVTYDTTIRRLSIDLGSLASPETLAGQTIRIGLSSGLRTIYHEQLVPYTFEFQVRE